MRVGIPTVASLEAVRPGAGRAWGAACRALLRHERLVRKVALRHFEEVKAGSLKLAAEEDPAEPA